MDKERKKRVNNWKERRDGYKIGKEKEKMHVDRGKNEGKRKRKSWRNSKETKKRVKKNTF
jgi:hypothetical protein